MRKLACIVVICLTAAFPVAAQERAPSESTLLGAKPLNQWRKELSDPDPKVHSAGARELVRLGDSAFMALPLLLELQKEDRELVRENSLWTLRNLPKDRVVSSLLSLLNDRNSRLRDVAAFVLGEIQPDAKAVLPVLREAITGRDNEVRVAAAAALFRLERSTKAVLPVLVLGVQEKSPFSKRIAISTLTLAVPSLQDLLNDSDEQTRGLALVALRAALTSFEKREAIYKEGGLLARVRLENIRVDAKGVSANVVVIPTPSLTDRNGWDIYAAWEIFSCSHARWHARYVSWTISFDDQRGKAIDAIIKDASLNEDARARRIREIMLMPR